MFNVHREIEVILMKNSDVNAFSSCPFGFYTLVDVVTIPAYVLWYSTTSSLSVLQALRSHVLLLNSHNFFLNIG